MDKLSPWANPRFFTNAPATVETGVPAPAAAPVRFAAGASAGEGDVRVTDFGIATARSDSAEFVATPQYMAPEQFSGSAASRHRKSQPVTP